MIRIAMFVVLVACVAFQLTESFHIEEVFVVNSTDSKVLEDVKFEIGKSKSDPIPGLVEVKYDWKKKTPGKTPAVKVVNTKKSKKIKRHRHLRRKCCAAGQKAGKYGLSCLIPRNFKNMFFNLVTQTRQKYQGTVSKSVSHRFKSQAVFEVYKEIRMCVKRQRKSVVEKCCKGYVKKMRRRG